MKSERSKPLSKLSKEERKLKRGSVSFKKILKKKRSRKGSSKGDNFHFDLSSREDPKSFKLRRSL